MSLFDDETMAHLRKTAHEAEEFEGWMVRQMDDEGHLPEGLAGKAEEMRSEVDAGVRKLETMAPERSSYDLSEEVARLAANGADNALGLMMISQMLSR